MATPTQRRSRVKRGAAWLPVVGLLAMIALIAAGGFHSSNRPGETPKRLVSQRKDAPPARWVTAVPRHRDKPIRVSPTIRGPTLEPVARATGPGGGADGTLRIAASLIDPVVEATTVVETKPSESPGTAPITVRETSSRPTFTAHAEEVASLTPQEQPAAAPPAWRLYGQKFDAADKRPRVALIVAGYDDDMTGLIDTLPAAVTLALDPYARRLPEWIEIAHARGHEVMLTLSAPPVGRGQRDAGPMAILSSLDPKENLERLDWALDRATGFVGVVDIVGNRPPDETAPILAKLSEHGLMLVSGTALSGQAAVLPVATGNVVISPNLSHRELEQKLVALQDIAKRDGHAVGIAVVTPVLLHRLATWLASLPNQSIVLAPATAMIAAKPDAGIAQAGIADK